jgi:hypothetical protein
VERFHARIDKEGVNAFVEIPERVSRAFCTHARSGRIRVEGILNGHPMRGTLVPTASGRHRFFVNQAMQRRSSVGVGDRVRFELRPSSWEIEIPADVAKALRAVKGALAAFEALAPSHRRELVRYIDDAKTPATRRRRIEKAAEHALGRCTPASRGRKGKPLWNCPRCGNDFVNKNQYHSCRRGSIDDVFASKPPEVRKLFDGLLRILESFGPVKVVAYRDRVGFMVRVRFAGASPRSKWLDVSFWLPRRLEHPRIRRLETIYPNAHVHSVRVTRLEDFDPELSRWLREAYAVGCQEHLAS